MGYYPGDYMVGTINHVEIPVKDMKKAKEFFNKVFDWEKHYSDFSEGYSLVLNAENENGVSLGLYVSDQAATGITPVIHVADIEKTLDIVEKSGGKIVKGKELISEDIGYSGYFTDPFGTQWGLFSRD